MVLVITNTFISIRFEFAAWEATRAEEILTTNRPKTKSCPSPMSYEPYRWSSYPYYSGKQSAWLDDYRDDSGN